MNLKDIFKFARDKGYDIFHERDNPFQRTQREYNESQDDFIDQSVIDANPRQVSSELSLIQKWLRDEHEIYVLPTPANSVNIYGRNFDTEIKWVPVYSHVYSEMEKETKFASYEQALSEGIAEALKFI